MVGFDTSLFGQVSVTLLVIMDPLGSVPLFLALTKNRTPKRRALAAYQAVTVALAVISVFAIFGRQILNQLGITVPALQGSGGLLLLLVALELLTGKESPQEEVTDVNVALVPLGTPLLAGPGAIVATIVFVQGAHGARDALAIIAGVLVVHVVLALVLRFSVVLLKILRDGGITLLTRVFGLLLSAIAVQLVAEGVAGFIDAHHR